MSSWTLPEAPSAAAARFRLMAVDLDSLASGGRPLSAADASSLRTAHAVGVKVVLASTMSPALVHRYWASLGLGAPVIAFDGALVHDFPTQRTELGYPLNRELLAGLIHEVLRVAPDAAIALESGDGWAVNRVGPFAQSIAHRAGGWPQRFPDLGSFLDRPVYRVTVEAPAARPDVLDAILAQEGVAGRRLANSAVSTVQSAAASRRAALAELAGMLEVSLDEVMVIDGAAGDGGRPDSTSMATAVASVVSGALLAAELSAASARYAIQEEMTPEGNDNDLWPTTER